MGNRLMTMFEENPIIAAIKDQTGLASVLKCDCKIVFVLYGNVLNIVDIVQQLKSRDKMVFVNIDLIDGFSSKEIVIELLKRDTQADGVLSSKAGMIKAAKAHGFYTIHRLFIIDSFSFDNIEKQVSLSEPDALQILPGWPKLITWTKDKIRIPIITGGLICAKEDVVAALGAGAMAISSTNADVWNL